MHEAYILFPDGDRMIKPFLLNPEQEVSFHYFVFAAGEYLIWVMVFVVIHELFEQARDITSWFVIFQSLEVVEYFLTYNEAIIHIPVPREIFGEYIGINITNIKTVVMFALIVKKYFTWNSGK